MKLLARLLLLPVTLVLLVFGGGLTALFEVASAKPDWAAWKRFHKPLFEVLPFWRSK